jgi:ankyrin repeat protein
MKKLTDLSTEYSSLGRELVDKRKQLEDLSEQIKSYEQRKSELSSLKKENKKLTDYFTMVDSTLNELSIFKGQRIETAAMIGRNIPKSELINSKTLSKICEKKSKVAFDDLLLKLRSINDQDAEGMTLLMYSLKHSFWYGIDRLLEMGADVNIVDNNGFNALMYACLKPRLKYVAKIAEKTLDIDKKSHQGNNALFYLCHSLSYIYSSEKAEELKEYDVSNIQILPDSNLTVSLAESLKGIHVGGISFILAKEITFSLVYANGEVYSLLASSKQIQLKGSALECKISKLIDCFILKNADINAKCQQDLMPLHLACAIKNTYLVKCLIEKGTNLWQKDASGCDGFMWLSKVRDFGTMSQLLAKGRDINSLDGRGMTLFYFSCLENDIELATFLKQKGADINILSINGLHPLHGAVYNGHTTMVDKLLEWGVDIDVKSTTGLTPLQYYLPLKHAKLEIVKYLHSKGASLGSLENGVSLIYLAASGGNKDIVEFFISLGLDPHSADINGYYPIHAAVHHNNIEAMKVLIKHKPFIVNQVTRANISPLYYSLGYGQQEVSIETIKLLLDNGADASIPTYNGDTPMHIAHCNADKEALELLIARGANINTQNNDKKTPLHCMIEKQNLDLALKLEILKLYQDKYDFSLRDIQGKSAFDYAKEYCTEAAGFIGSNYETNESSIGPITHGEINITGADHEFTLAAELN